MNERQARLWLSEPRYARFLTDCGGNHRDAIALYEWHAQLSAASFKLIHHFEVLVRNAIDGVLGEAQPEAPIKRVIMAIERLEKDKNITRGRVVAGLSFAFWAGLFGRGYEELWRHCLRFAFSPNGSLVRKDLSARMKLLQHFRNRVAHHDSLLGQNVPARLEDMLTIAGWIDPAAQAWLATRSDAITLAHSAPPASGLAPN